MLRPPSEGEARATSSEHRRAWVCAALLGASWSNYFSLALAAELARNACAGLSLDETGSIREAALAVLSARHARAQLGLSEEGIFMLAEHAERTWAAVQEYGPAVDQIYDAMHTGGGA